MTLPRGKGSDDSGDVVTKETESGCPAFLLHGSPERRLGAVRHRISLVEDDQLEGGNEFAVGFPVDRSGSSLLRERLDLGADYI